MALQAASTDNEIKVATSYTSDVARLPMYSNVPDNPPKTEWEK